jgi:hypothetical protein
MVGRASGVRPGRPGRLVAGQGTAHLATIAKRICEHCLVRSHCLDYALSGADTWAGITTGGGGGTTPRERTGCGNNRKPWRHDERD